MLNLSSPIGDIGRLGKVMVRRLQKIGLETCGDLLFYFPFRYEDLSRLVPISIFDKFIFWMQKKLLAHAAAKNLLETDNKDVKP